MVSAACLQDTEEQFAAILKDRWHFGEVSVRRLKSYQETRRTQLRDYPAALSVLTVDVASSCVSLVRAGMRDMI
jgi:hypothetical protein